MNWLKKMTPEEAAKFRAAGAKFMIIPFLIIVVIAMVIVFSTVQKSSNKQKLADTVQNNIVTQNVCHKDLKQCGSGCIPGNAVCCDKINGNSYCLWPDTQCKTNPETNGEKERFICSNDEKVKSYDCPIGQVFCGMFCIDIGKKCCLGGVCDENKTETTNQISDPKKIINDEKTEKGFIKIDSGGCKIHEETQPPYPWVYSLIVGSGSAGGQVGDSFDITSYITRGWTNNYSQIGIGISCSSWTKKENVPFSSTCIREAGQPYTTDWTITLEGPAYLKERAVESSEGLSGYLRSASQPSQRAYLEFKCIDDN